MSELIRAGSGQAAGTTRIARSRRSGSVRTPTRRSTGKQAGDGARRRTGADAPRLLAEVIVILVLLKVLGLDIPPTVLALADEVIE